MIAIQEITQTGIMMVIDNKFEIGQIVYVITDTDQLPRIVTSFEVTPGSILVYRVYCGTVNSSHYDFELSHERNTVITL